MRIVGSRQEKKLCLHASGKELVEAAAFNEMLQSAFQYGRVYICKKGVYRFKDHAGANQHQEQCIADTMAYIFNENRKEK